MRDRFALAYARSLPLCFCFVNRRHPRALARIRPTQLGLWSFAVAIAHGAGLMLVPIYLGLSVGPLTSTRATRRRARS